MRAIALLTALAVPGAIRADGAPWWQGAFAWDPAWCVNAGRIGSVTPAPVAITADAFLGFENSCRIVRQEHWQAVDAVRLVLDCQSEGARYDEEMMVMQGGQGGVWIKWPGGAPERFHRCGGGQ